MLPAVAFLQQMGLVDNLEASAVPLRKIRMIDATERLLRAPETLFDSVEAGYPAFGWNFENERLLAALKTMAAEFAALTHITEPAVAISHQATKWTVDLVEYGPLTTELLVGADGRRSLVRTAANFAAKEHKFDESALVCDLQMTRTLTETSVEFHYPHGPFTLVPGRNARTHLVWIDEPETLQRAASDAENFAETLTTKAMRLFGPIAPISKPVIFSLSTLRAEHVGRGGVVLVGEAAHAFPPIGAQGLNLGLRDIADLVALAEKSARKTPDWANALSSNYEAMRASDVTRTSGFVDTLFRSLLSEMLPAQALRSAGLWALKLSPGARTHAFSAGMGQPTQ